MKRSEINQAIDFALSEFDRVGLSLPHYAYWTADDWQKAGSEYDSVKRRELGWAVTDFGQGDFASVGITMFDLRNGELSGPAMGTPYGEKVLLLRPGQHVPFHRHLQKVEDIINRFSGILCIQVYNVSVDGKPDLAAGGTIYCDGVRTEFAAGQILEFEPGESVTITPSVFHSLWAKADAGVVVAGEVTTFCDPHNDNQFLEGSRRFMQIDEDENTGVGQL